MPPPASEQKPQQRFEDHAPEHFSSIEGQERLQEDPDKVLEDRISDKNIESHARGPESLSGIEAQERLQEDDASPPKAETVPDNIARVPDEHLPSHRDRQRWDWSKQISDFMDEVLPKLAVVTQKVNTYTGTDYSGVEALRREIKEQGVYCLV